jgi:hypothetical protein
MKPFCGLYFEAQRPKINSNPDACLAYSKTTLRLEGDWLYNKPLVDVMFATGANTSIELDIPFNSS